MATMYHLTQDYIAVLEMAQDPEIPSDAIADTLESIEGEMELKAENTAIIINELKAHVEKIKKEKTRLDGMQKSIENNIKLLKQNIYKAMKITGKTKFSTTLYKFAVGKNSPALVVDDMSKIPDEYLIPQPPKIDNEAIRNELKKGTKFDFAHLEQGESLRIR